MSRRRIRSLALFVLAPALLCAPSVLALSRFIRGEMNGDGRLDLTDAVAILFHLFGGTSGTGCLRAGDVDDSGQLDVTDPLALLGYLFNQGLAPRSPFPDCGADPTEDALTCTGHAPCLESDVDPVITEWTVPWAGSRPRDPFPGGDGRIWFVGQTGNYVAYLEPEEGKFKRFELPAGAAPHNVIVGELVWCTGNGDAHIGRLDPQDGKVTIYPMPDPAASDPHTLAFDRGGNDLLRLWDERYRESLGPFHPRVRDVAAELRRPHRAQSPPSRGGFLWALPTRRRLLPHGGHRLLRSPGALPGAVLPDDAPPREGAARDRGAHAGMGALRLRRELREEDRALRPEGTRRAPHLHGARPRFPPPAHLPPR